MKKTTKSKKVYNYLNFPPDHVKGEQSDLASEFVPDQSMTMRELLKRQQQGLPVATTRVPIFADDDELVLQQGVNLKTLDLVDLQVIREKTEEAIIQHHEEQIKAKKAKADADFQSRIRKEAEKLAKEVKPE